MIAKKAEPSGLRKDWHGIKYQMRVALLYMWRALEDDKKFYSTSEVAEAGKLDDGILFEKQENGNVEMSLFQIKHQIKEDNIKETDLFCNNPEGPFNILKYLKSLLNIKALRKSAHSDFSVPVKSINLVTNRNINEGGDLWKKCNKNQSPGILSAKNCPDWTSFQLKKEKFAKKTLVLSQGDSDREELIVELASELRGKGSYKRKGIIDKYLVPLSRIIFRKSGKDIRLNEGSTNPFISSVLKEMAFQSRAEEIKKKLEVCGNETAVHCLVPFENYESALKAGKNLSHLLKDSSRPVPEELKFLGSDQARHSFVRYEKLTPSQKVLRRAFIEDYIDPFTGDIQPSKRFTDALKYLYPPKSIGRKDVVLKFLENYKDIIFKGDPETIEGNNSKLLNDMIHTHALATKHNEIVISSVVLVDDLPEIYSRLTKEYKELAGSMERVKNTLSNLRFKTISKEKVINDDDLLRQVPSYPSREEVEEFLGLLNIYAGFPSADKLRDILDNKIKKEGRLKPNARAYLETAILNSMTSVDVKYHDQDSFRELYNSYSMPFIEIFINAAGGKFVRHFQIVQNPMNILRLWFVTWREEKRPKKDMDETYNKVPSPPLSTTSTTYARYSELLMSRKHLIKIHQFWERLKNSLCINWTRTARRKLDMWHQVIFFEPFAEEDPPCQIFIFIKTDSSVTRSIFHFLDINPSTSPGIRMRPERHRDHLPKHHGFLLKSQPPIKGFFSVAPPKAIYPQKLRNRHYKL